MSDEAPKMSAKEKFIRSMISGLKQEKNAFYERRGELYVDTAVIGGGKDIVKLHSSAFNNFMLDLGHRSDNVLLRAADCELIAEHVAIYAQNVAKPLSSDPRACWHAGALWLNPGWKDGKLIRIGDGKWSIEAAPGRLFAPLPVSMQMPVPVATDAKLFPGIISKGIVDFGEYHAFFCTMLATMMMPMDDVQPIIIITGEGAKGKTTTMKLATQLVDPDQGNECMIVSEDQRNILVTCQYRKTLGLDNASRLPISDDLLSQMYAGGTYNERKLYENNELSQMRIERMRVLINGVSPDFSKSDFFTKAIFLEQPSVTHMVGAEERFSSLSAVEAEWAATLPTALGALLSVLAEGIPHYQAWQARRKKEGRRADAIVRFVEFAVMGEAFARAMGYEADVFSKQVRALNARSKETAVQTDECTQLLLSWAEGARGNATGVSGSTADDLWSFQSGPAKADRYEITTGDLHAELKKLAYTEGYNHYKMTWLNSPVAFGRRLKTSMQTFNNSGWSMTMSARRGDATTWIIQKKV